MSRKKRDIPRFSTPIIETHCHLDYLEADALEQTLERAREVGVSRFVTIAVSPDNLDVVLQLAGSHPEVWCTQGIHPHEAEHFDDAVADRIVRACHEPRVLAVGEIGLDYYYDHADRAVQRRVFERQLQIAIEADLPVVIHTRDADADTQAILAEHAGALSRRGVIHSFTSSLALAQFCLDAGFMLGFNGIATFNRADNVREVVRHTPVERIVLETDSPYLTPVPYRGKPNAPFYLPFIAEKIAELKELPVESLLSQVAANSEALFDFGAAA